MKTNLLVLLASLSINSLIQNVQAQEAPFRVDPTKRQFIDKFGRSVIFHGVNIVYKLDPFIPSRDKFDPQLSLTAEDIGNLKKWGLNLVRLGVMWEAVERTSGSYDQKYLDNIEKIINDLGKAGIYTMVDMHQDASSRRTCGEGIPNFLLNKDTVQHDCPSYFTSWITSQLGLFNKCKTMKSFDLKYDADGNPNLEDCTKRNFWDYYFTPESQQLMRNIYENIDGFQDKFVNYWTELGRRFANNPYVVGFDPLNEPMPHAFDNPNYVLQDGLFDKEILQPLYKRVYDAFSQTDKTKVMFFEPSQQGDMSGNDGGMVIPVGFTQPPGGSDKQATHTLNDHSYCCQFGVCSGAEPRVDQYAQCKKLHDYRIGTRNDDAKKMGIPLIISEFGACFDGMECFKEIQATTEVCDDYLAHWVYWQFKNYKDITTSAQSNYQGFYNKNGSLQTLKVKAISRTYIKATQGTLFSQKFDAETYVFIGKFKYQSVVQAPTLIYYNKDYYQELGRGYTLTIYDNSQAFLTVGKDYSVNDVSENHVEINMLNDKYTDEILMIIFKPNTHGSAQMEEEDDMENEKKFMM
eukprot:403365531